MRTTRPQGFVIGGLLAFAMACSDSTGIDGEDHPNDNTLDEVEEGPDGTEEDSRLPENAAAALENYANIAFALYDDALTRARELQTAIVDFVEEPSEQRLAAAQTAYLAAREPYGQTECFRFQNGPIDDEDGPEGLLNAWPLDETFVDYVYADIQNPVDGEFDFVGLVNDVDFEITAANIEAKNEEGGEANVASGYHAIEFLLFFQDIDPEGPGQRDYRDFLELDHELKGDSTVPNAARRRTYLVETTKGLVANLESVRDEFNPAGEGNYYDALLSMDIEAAYHDVLNGLAIFAAQETGNERLGTPLDERNQEEEHSCFSDDTNNDMKYSALCMQHTFTGSYTRLDGSEVSGPSLRSVLESADAAAASALQSLVDDVVRISSSLTVRFDQAIAEGLSDADPGRKELLELKEAFNAFEPPFVAAADALGIEPLGVELP